MADLQKKFEKVGLAKKEEIEQEQVDREGQAAIKKIAAPLGSQPYPNTDAPAWSHIPVRGIRAFRLDHTTLTGLAYTLPWMPGTNECVCGYADEWREQVDARRRAMGAGFGPLMRPFRAFVGMGYDKPHPLGNCTHGFYSLFDVNQYNEYAGYLTGMIEGWGEVIAGPDGFRCEKAKIVALVLPNADGALGTKEEEAEKTADPKGKKKKKPKDEPSRVIRWYSDHEWAGGPTFAFGLTAMMFVGFAGFSALPWSLLALLPLGPLAYLNYAAWAADFSDKWGIGSDYWSDHHYPAALLQAMRGGAGRGMDVPSGRSNAIRDAYGVPIYTSIEAMLERHPIERGEV